MTPILERNPTQSQFFGKWVMLLLYLLTTEHKNTEKNYNAAGQYVCCNLTTLKARNPLNSQY